MTTALGAALAEPTATLDSTQDPGTKKSRKTSRARKTGLPVQAVIGAAMLVALVAAAFVARFVFQPSLITPDVLSAPSAAHLFGTDASGRDVLLRTLAAALADLPLALGSTVAAAVVGTALGLLASSGRGSDGIMRVVDGFQAFPTLILVLVVVQITGGGETILLITLAVLNMPRFIRLTRTEAMQVSSSRFVFFAQVIGAKRRHVLLRHVLPNVSGAILSQASISAAISLSAIGAMSFLGLGIAPPTPSWGAMIQLGSGGFTIGQWWPVLFPCLGLVWSIVAFNLVADSLDAHFARESK